jgi:hypothetical protein
VSRNAGWQNIADLPSDTSQMWTKKKKKKKKMIMQSETQSSSILCSTCI